VKKENIAKEIAEKEDEEDEKIRRGRTKGWAQPFQKEDISFNSTFLNIIKTLNSILFFQMMRNNLLKLKHEEKRPHSHKNSHSYKRIFIFSILNENRKKVTLIVGKSH
jgi:hypothetical protein